MATVYKCLRLGADDYILKPVRKELITGVWQNVWRKRKEKKVLSMLEQERTHRAEMEEKVRGLQSAIVTATETPVNIIIQTVADLLRGEGLKEEARATLSLVLTALSSSDLYQPAFEKFLTAGEIDDDVRVWLANEVLRNDGSAQGDARPSREPTGALNAAKARCGRAWRAARMCALTLCRVHRQCPRAVDSRRREPRRRSTRGRWHRRAWI